MNARRLKIPLLSEDVLALRVGDMVLLSGKIVTGRDKAHRFLRDERPDKKDMPFDLQDGVIYHCGPILQNINDTYSVVAAGPTTSIRMELYEADVIRAYGLRGIMGKGGMGPKTLEAMRECGCVYLNTISGAAVYLADSIRAVSCGWKVAEFGEAEAMWLFEVEDFPAVVTMDAYGKSLHDNVEKTSVKGLRKALGLSLPS
jgi:fumarate hydratase class I